MRSSRCPQGCDRTPKEDAPHPWADIWILLGGWLYFAEWQRGQCGARLEKLLEIHHRKCSGNLLSRVLGKAVRGEASRDSPL